MFNFLFFNIALNLISEALALTRRKMEGSQVIKVVWIHFVRILFYHLAPTLLVLFYLFWCYEENPSPAVFLSSRQFSSLLCSLSLIIVFCFWIFFNKITQKIYVTWALVLGTVCKVVSFFVKIKTRKSMEDERSNNLTICFFLFLCCPLCASSPILSLVCHCSYPSLNPCLCI